MIPVRTAQTISSSHRDMVAASVTSSAMSSCWAHQVHRVASPAHVPRPGHHRLVHPVRDGAAIRARPRSLASRDRPHLDTALRSRLYPGNLQALHPEQRSPGSTHKCGTRPETRRSTSGSECRRAAAPCPEPTPVN